MKLLERHFLWLTEDFGIKKIIIFLHGPRLGLEPNTIAYDFGPFKSDFAVEGFWS